MNAIQPPLAQADLAASHVASAAGRKLAADSQFGGGLQVGEEDGAVGLPFKKRRLRELSGNRDRPRFNPAARRSHRFEDPHLTIRCRHEPQQSQDSIGFGLR